MSITGFSYCVRVCVYVLAKKQNVEVFHIRWRSHTHTTQQLRYRLSDFQIESIHCKCIRFKGCSICDVDPCRCRSIMANKSLLWHSIDPMDLIKSHLSWPKNCLSIENYHKLYSIDANERMKRILAPCQLHCIDMVCMERYFQCQNIEWKQMRHIRKAANGVKAAVHAANNVIKRYGNA